MQEQHQQSHWKRKKCCRCRVTQKRGSFTSAEMPRSNRNECCSVTTISSHFCIHRDHESVRSCHLSPGCVGLKEAAKSSETNAASSASSAASSATAAGKFREGGKTSETNAASSGDGSGTERLSCGRLQNSGCVVCQCRVNKCRAGLSQCHRRRKIGRKRRIVRFNSHNEGWRSHWNRPAQQRGSASAAKTSETNAKASETSAESSKRLPHRPASSAASSASSASASKMRSDQTGVSSGRAAPRRHPRRRQRRLAVRRRQLRAKVRRNPRQRAPRQRQNGQRILHPPWRLRMRARRKGIVPAQQARPTALPESHGGNAKSR